MSTAGQLGGGLVGGIAGFFLTGGSPTGALYGAQIGLGIGGYLDPAPGPTTEGPRLSDRSVQTSTYGAVIPRVYGTAPVAGNLIWLQGNQLTETITKTKKGGKGGGSKATTVTYSYSATCAFALADTRALGAPFIGIRRIWTSQGLYYDAGSSDPDTIQASNAAAQGFTFYPGSATQLQDPSIQADIGAANTPAYRGLAYIVFNDLPLASHGNSLVGLQLKVELMQLGAVYSYQHTIGNNPALREWCTPAWNGTVFCSMSQNSAHCCTSPDGLTWTQHSTPVATSGVASIASNGSIFVAVGYTGSKAYTSSDNGITWVSRSLPNALNYGLGLCFGNGYFIAHSEDGYCLRSPDGIAWTRFNYPHTGDYSGDIIWSPAHSLYVTLYRYGVASYALTSPDGATWTETLLPRYSFNWNSIAAKGGQICICSNSGSDGVLLSTNATTWVRYASSLNVPVSGVVSDGSVYVATANGRWYLSSDGIAWTATDLNPTVTTCTGPAWSGGVFAFLSGLLEAKSVIVTPLFVSAGSPPLASVVASECLQSGLLTSADIDVTALTSAVRGYRIGSLGTIRAALEPLRAAWPFDVVQDGYGIRFTPRGGASVVTIPAADLDARPAGESPGVQITAAREMDSQLPRRIEINFLDVDREYDAGLQYDERLNTAATNLETIDLPIVLTATEAAGKAQVLLYQRWLDRYTVGPIRLPSAYAGLQPADVVSLTTEEGLVDLRLTGINYTADNRLEITGKYSRPAIYTPTAVGAAGQSTGVATLTPVGASIYQLLDIPLVTDVQAVSGFIAAMYGAKSGWQGGVLMQSTDAGANWAAIDDFGPPGATIGAATNTIGAVESRLIDKASQLTVVLANGELSSTTELAMLGGANHFAYGAHGRWEIIAAQTCALQSGSTYLLSNLLRGRFGTEQYMGAHLAGDIVVLLDADDASFIPMSTGSIGLARDYRGITLNRDISTDSNQSFTYIAVNLKPLAPLALTGNRHPATNDWALTWLRRTRSGGEWRDYVDADLGETSEQYQVDIHSDGSYTTVKRTLTVTAQGADYTSADQVSDFGSNQATLYVKIFQLSPTVGRGAPLTASITR